MSWQAIGTSRSTFDPKDSGRQVEADNTASASMSINNDRMRNQCPYTRGLESFPDGPALVQRLKERLGLHEDPTAGHATILAKQVETGLGKALPPSPIGRSVSRPTRHDA